jgi:hypothetical protein
LRDTDGKQELRSGKDFNDNCGLFKNFSASRVSSKGALRITLGFRGLGFGGDFA